MNSWLKKYLVAAVLVCVAACFLVGPIQEYRESQHLETSRNRLKQIGIALHAYHKEYRAFPPAVVLGPDGKIWHSWRVLLLPFLGEDDLAAQYRFDEPWNGPSNRRLINACPDVFVLPSSEARGGYPNACAVIGKQTNWPAQQPMRVRDIKRGSSNTIHVVEMSPIREWTNPHDLMASDFVRAHRKEGRARLVLLGDGTVREIGADCPHNILSNLLTPNGATHTFKGNDWPELLVADGPAAGAARPAVDSTRLKRTSVLASWNEQFKAHNNAVWCAAFQLCWDSLKSKATGDVEASTKVPLIEQLNASPFDPGCLDPGSYEVSAGSADSQSTAALQQRLNKRIPELKVELRATDSVPSLRLFSTLRKEIRYCDELSRFETPLKFACDSSTKAVKSFGHKPLTGEWMVLKDTVTVADYVSDDDFIVVLHTAGKRRDEIVLARIPAKKSLFETWKAAERRIRKPHPNRVYKSLRANERLEIPVIDFHVEHEFRELTGCMLTNARLSSTPLVKSAREIMRFRLDELGMDLIAAAELATLGSFGDEPEFDPERPRMLVFDQSFFVAAREQGAAQPYFLSWVANAEVMELFE